MIRLEILQFTRLFAALGPYLTHHQLLPRWFCIQKKAYFQEHPISTACFWVWLDAVSFDPPLNVQLRCNPCSLHASILYFGMHDIHQSQRPFICSSTSRLLCIIILHLRSLQSVDPSVGVPLCVVLHIPLSTLISSHRFFTFCRCTEKSNFERH